MLGDQRRHPLELVEASGQAGGAEDVLGVSLDRPVTPYDRTRGTSARMPATVWQGAGA